MANKYFEAPDSNESGILEKLMQGEQDAIRDYKNAILEMPDHAEILRHILNEEIQHKRYLRNISMNKPVSKSITARMIVIKRG